MQVRKERLDDKLLVFVEGQIDTGTCGAFGKEVLSEGNELDIVCDFEKVTYVSSAGLRTILTIHKSQCANNKSFLLKNVTKDVFDVLEMTGFTAFLNVETNF